MSPWIAGRRLVPRLALLLLPLVIAACGTITTSLAPASPTDFPGLTGRLAKVKIVVADYVSGDAGCSDPDLVSAAISFHASGLDQVAPVKMYIYVFRNQPAFDRHIGQIGPCAQAFVTDPTTYEQIEEPPYVVVGQGPWAPQFKAAFQTVLAAAAGGGG